MVTLLFSLCAMIAADTPELPGHVYISRETETQLEKRGLPVSYDGIVVLINEAFDKEDPYLFEDISKTLSMPSYAEIFADLVIKRYIGHPDGVFKKKIAVKLAITMFGVQRIAYSRYGCMFMAMPLEGLLYPKPDAENMQRRMTAISCVDRIGFAYNLNVQVYFVRSVLTIPIDEMLVPWELLRSIKKNFELLPPETAYHIYQRFKGVKNFEEFKKDYEAKCGAYVSGEKQLPPNSMENILKQLDEKIAQNEKEVCDKYGSIEPPPYQYKHGTNTAGIPDE